MILLIAHKSLFHQIILFWWTLIDSSLHVFPFNHYLRALQLLIRLLRSGISEQINMSLIFEISDPSFFLYLYFLSKFCITSYASSENVIGFSLLGQVSNKFDDVRRLRCSLVYSTYLCLGMQMSKIITEFDPLFSSLSCLWSCFE